MQQLAEESHGQWGKPNSSAGCYPADAGRQAAALQLPAIHGENTSCGPRPALGGEAHGGGSEEKCQGAPSASSQAGGGSAQDSPGCRAMQKLNFCVAPRLCASLGGLCQPPRV